MTFPDLKLQVGFTSSASTSTYLHLDDAVRGKLDTATLAGSDVFTDVTTDSMSVSLRRGATRVNGQVLRYDGGTLNATLKDTDRDYDPTNLSGPYVSAGVTQVAPMRPVRLQAAHSSTTYDLWRGFADAFTLQYLPADQVTIVGIQASDATKVLQSYDRAGGGSVGGSENSGARISRILDSIGWSATDRVIATGDSTLQATTLAGNALTEAQLVQDSEIGELYCDGAGRIVYRNRLGVLEDSRSNTSQATFGDGGGSELPYESVVLSYDETQLVNDARITRVGGAEQSASDSTSITAYLTHSHERSDLLLETDGAALDYARWLVYQGKDPELRFESITLTRNSDSATEDLLFAQMLGREIGDRITIKRRPPGGGSVISRDVFIRGIEHEISPLSWRTTWQLQSATRYSFLTLDHATLGALDSNALAY